MRPVKKATIDFHNSSSLIIDSITDALGHKLPFRMIIRIIRSNPPSKPSQRNSATRSGIFGYDSIGRLQTITDEIGIQSAFTYSTAGTNFITSLQTPYGTTEFCDWRRGKNKWLEITDPLMERSGSNIWMAQSVAFRVCGAKRMTNSGLDVRTRFISTKNTPLTMGLITIMPRRESRTGLKRQTDHRRAF